MMKHLNRFFSLILLLACAAGMFVPSLGTLTSVIVIVSLACVIFSSFFQINLSVKSLTADFRLTVWFILLRFILLPVLLFLLVNLFDGTYARAVLLTMLLPAAVSSPAFSTLFGGKADLSLKILLYTSFLSIVTIPLILSLLLHSTADVPAGSLMVTLTWTIVLPFAIHLPLRRSVKVRSFMLRYNSPITLFALSVLGLVVTAKNKETILHNPALIGLYAIIALLLYGFMYLLGYLLLPKNEGAVRRTLSISSGANNIGLGVTLTALYFAGRINVFFIVSQVIWVLILIPVRHWLLKTK